MCNNSKKNESDGYSIDNNKTNKTSVDKNLMQNISINLLEADNKQKNNIKNNQQKTATLKEDNILSNIKAKIVEENKNKEGTFLLISSPTNRPKKKMEFMSTSVNLKKSTNDANNGNNNTKNEQNISKLKDEEFQMIGEQEIINRINFLYNRKYYSLLEDYIFIHLQYLIKIKQNFRLALYFVGKYSLSDLKFGLLSRYYLYEIKKFICNNIINLNDLKIIKDPYIIKYKEDNIYLKNVKNYFIYYHMIKHLLRISCEIIIYFHKFRKELHNPLSLQKYIKTKIYPVINASEEMITYIDKLKFIIKKIHEEEKHPIESVELSYLLTNFFKLIEGKIPQEIFNYISPIIYFRENEYKKLANEFHQFLMSNPLIISLNHKDSFDIKYFTNIFLNKLNYTYLELKNKDFHEKLFPGEMDLCKEHAFILKQFLFFNKNVYAKESTFLKSKEGYLISISFICKIFPNFKDDFSLIANIIFQENLIENKKSNLKKKEDNKITNIYSFFLSRDFYVFALTKNFYLEYYLNHNNFRELRINFCQFFCIDENKFIEQIEKEIKKLLKKYKYINNNIPLRETNKAYSIFQNIKIENTFKIRDEKLLENYFYPTIFFYDKIDKKKLFQLIPELNKIIDEIGLDYDWYIKLKNFKERLEKSNNFKKRNDSEIDNAYHDNINIKEKRFSTVIRQINNNLNNYNSAQFFEAIYSIKRLGFVIYYIVNLKETINNNFDQTLIINELHTFKKIKSLSLINKDLFDKINSKNSLKVEKRSSSVILKEEINVEKNKIIFSEPKNKNNNNINTNSNNRYKEENKKESKKNIGSSINNKSKKNERVNKLYKKESSKSIKNRKQSSNEEDDENSFLISKNKFKELVANNHKINKILIINIFLLISITIILIIIKIIFCINGFKESNNILTASISLEMLKVDIYYEAIFSLMYCVYEKDELLEKDKINSDAKKNLINILNHLKVMQDQVKIILNNRFSINIFKVVEESFFIHTLNDDWTVENRKADILNEMRRLSYILYNLTTTNDICNITFFYEYMEKGPDYFNDKNISSPNDIQQIFYYILSNTISNFHISFEKLSNQCIITLKNMWINFQSILFYLFYSILIILILVIVIYIIKACYDSYYYQILFLYYYDIEEEQLKFYSKIKYFHKVILQFNRININSFEFIRNNDVLIEYEEDINKKNTKNFSNKDSQLNEFPNKKKLKKRSSIINKSLVSNNNQFNEQNNFNVNNILNDSMNGSSLQFLNMSNKKSPLNNNIEYDINNSYKSEKDKKEIDNYEENSLDLLLKISNKIIPNSIKISLVLIVLCLIIYILLCFFNIIEIYSQNKTWDFSINLLMNILERIPRLLGMILYSCINVISNNINSLESQININKSNYLEYFEANSLYYSEDIIFKYFNNSYFGELLKDNLRINYNLENYLTSNTIFINTRKLESLLNLEGYFCIYGTIGEMSLDLQYSSFYDFIKEIDVMALKCLEDNSGINEYGVKNEINYILQEITNIYIDFISYKDSNITLEKAREIFFNSKEIKRIFNDFQNSFLLYFNTIINAIKIDFGKLKIFIEKIENIYSFFLFLVNFVVLFFLIFAILKSEKYKRLFIYVSEIPKKSSN